MQDFRNLDAWAKAHALALKVYKETQSLPREEVFGIASQLRKSSLAIPTRIAEGTARSSDADFAVDLRKAIASSGELEYLILFAADQGLWPSNIASPLTEAAIEIRKMLYGLLRKL